MSHFRFTTVALYLLGMDLTDFDCGLVDVELEVRVLNLAHSSFDGVELD